MAPSTTSNDAVDLQIARRCGQGVLPGHGKIVRVCRVHLDGEGVVGEQWAEGCSEAVFDAQAGFIFSRNTAIVEPDLAPGWSPID